MGKEGKNRWKREKKQRQHGDRKDGGGVARDGEKGRCVGRKSKDDLTIITDHFVIFALSVKSTLPNPSATVICQNQIFRSRHPAALKMLPFSDITVCCTRTITHLKL